MKYLVVTRQLGNVIDAKDEKQCRAAIRQLKKVGYKKPTVFRRCANQERFLS
jgi:hypothetical protein